MAQNPLSMRASTQDREETESVLTASFRDGRLKATELSDRLALLHDADTYLDLRNLVEDLPHALSFLDPNPSPNVRTEIERRPLLSMSTHPVYSSLLLFTVFCMSFMLGPVALPIFGSLLMLSWYHRRNRAYWASSALNKPNGGHFPLCK
jgi:hypothetical protein